MANEIIIPLLLSIIAFWLVRYIKRSDKRMDEFTRKVDELTEKIVVLLEDYRIQSNACSKQHDNINNNFKEHSGRLENHEIRLTKLESKNE